MPVSVKQIEAADRTIVVLLLTPIAPCVHLPAPSWCAAAAAIQRAAAAVRCSLLDARVQARVDGRRGEHQMGQTWRRRFDPLL